MTEPDTGEEFAGWLRSRLSPASPQTEEPASDPAAAFAAFIEAALTPTDDSSTQTGSETT